MNNYEAMFIFKPNIDEEKLEKEMKSVEQAIKINAKGEVKYDNLGKKTMAYEVKKFKEGVYVNYVFTAQPLAIREIKETLKHKDDILRFMFLVKGRKK
ncbi:MAG: 30S ribosomal protein S6 [bacterium]